MMQVLDGAAGRLSTICGHLASALRLVRRSALRVDLAVAWSRVGWPCLALPRTHLAQWHRQI